MVVILNKDVKIQSVVEALPEGFTQDEFVDKFIATHPKDWAKIQQTYRHHERRTRPGNSHPMPEPRQYLLNALNVWRNQQ
jgi:hypothetical protein